MEDKITNIKERVLQIAEFKGVSKEKFFDEIGMTYGNFKGKSKETPLNSNAIADILTIYKDISAEWLLTGVGSMTKKEVRNENILAEPKTEYGGLKKYPLVEQTAIGGFGSNSFTLQDRDIKEYYVVPKFRHKQVDFMIEVEGSSMYPKYNSGDIVACKIIQEDGFIQWNKTHVVGTKDQGIIIKRIKKGSQETTLTMVSDNENYDPFEVPKDEITGLALVVGVIRLE